MFEYYNVNYVIYATGKLPYSIRVLLESAVRNCDEFQVKKSDVQKILDWEKNQAVEEGVEVAFKPARVILQVKCILILSYQTEIHV